ncbi:SLBB domain-containing protein [Candidatus Uabimicrobium amorphum]|uniref:Sugar transporter n=1 Tax=Uabimicrobium amorphum TaxID=2596890 RepID=A0A5S9IQ67_UABAM|nr:SLBB domain-containing protein [Candidatus Uabimicrobium amorphum]BBM86058.1 sugar transporter [Candidatus Uabimicrobium amorphum]
MLRVILLLTVILASCTNDNKLPGYEPPPQEVEIENNDENKNSTETSSVSEDKWIAPKLQKKYREPVLIPGDTIRIEITNEPKLNKDILIPRTGAINYQLIKEFKVVGKTVQEVTVELKEKLSDYIEEPLVSINVINWKKRQVYIDGLEKGSRAIPLPNDEIFTISRFLLSIGISPNLKTVKGVELIREDPVDKGKKETFYLPIDAIFENYDTENDIALQAEDLIVIKEKAKVYVQGRIVTPGNYPINDDKKQTLWDVILLAGGPRPDANLDNVEVIRESEQNKRVTFKLSVSPKAQKPFYLQKNDIITIPSKDEESKVVSVFGEVRRPGAIRMPESRTRMSLVMGLAGGLTEFASPKIRIIRHLPGGVTKKYVVNFDKILQGSRAENMLIRGGDLIIVDAGW